MSTMQLDQATTNDRIGLLWEWVKVALNVGSMVAFILEQAFGPEDGVLAHEIPTSNLIEYNTLRLEKAVYLLCVLMGSGVAIHHMYITYKRQEKLNQMYRSKPTVKQNVEEIRRELDLRESIKNPEILGCEADIQLCKQFPIEKRALAHELRQAKVNNQQFTLEHNQLLWCIYI